MNTEQRDSHTAETGHRLYDPNPSPTDWVCIDCRELSMSSMLNRGALVSDLCDVVERHGLRSVVVCGTQSDGLYFGTIVGRSDRVPVSEVATCAMNVGRLWQFMRETIRAALDKFEEKGISNDTQGR